ncbi:MAG: pyruvate kinase, partial [Planctomycetia bacterium]|nr:pyruvate kinase [Planctomycetia bacterium]
MHNGTFAEPTGGRAVVEPDSLTALIDRCQSLRAAMLHMEETWLAESDGLHASHRDSARNLLHYLALRSHDIRPLQASLAALGLSSLGRSEAHVLHTMDAVLQVLHRLADRPHQASDADAVGFIEGRNLLEQHTEALLGPQPGTRGVRIMVTMPGEAARDYTLVHELLVGGMDCMRINCAHDGPDIWLRIIQNLRRAEEATGRHCKVLMDLGGPKLRTGPVEPGPSVLKWRPTRDVFGRVQAPARIWLCAQEDPIRPPTPADAVVPIPADWLDRLHVGDTLKFRDARLSRRQLTIVDVTGRGCWAESARTVYLAGGTSLRLERAGHKSPKHGVFPVGDLPASEQTLLLFQGDTLLLTREPTPGRPATYDSNHRLLTPAQISCTLPEVFADVRPGERIWLDDGKIGGVIRSVEDDAIRVQITHARAAGEKLRADKGINLPDSVLRLPALTAKDLEDLEFVAAHADLVGLSFVHEVEDVQLLQGRLQALSGERVGIVLKIETKRGFEQLPKLLLAAMRWPSHGVMIARGDLAVEAGYERLAEVQEEILWICEAAHVPVVWATQVLESLAKEGIPSRAEITDAALAQRAECVMLNKGPHIVRAVQVLHDILT